MYFEYLNYFLFHKTNTNTFRASNAGSDCKQMKLNQVTLHKSAFPAMRLFLLRFNRPSSGRRAFTARNESSARIFKLRRTYKRFQKAHLNLPKPRTRTYVCIWFGPPIFDVYNAEEG